MLFRSRYIIAVVLLLMIGLFFVNILGRYVFGMALAWTEELVGYLFVYITMIGAAAACAEGANMGLSLFTDMLPKKLHKYVILITCIASCIVFTVLLYQGLIMIQSQIKYTQVTPTMRLPEWIFSAGIPIGSVFYIVRSIQLVVKAFKGG